MSQLLWLPCTDAAPSNVLEGIYYLGIHIAIAYDTDQVRAIHALNIKIEFRLGSNWTRSVKLARGRCNMACQKIARQGKHVAFFPPTLLLERHKANIRCDSR